MKLRNISARNLKGRTFSHDLTDAVAIMGPNFSGKTAIIEGIRLALMGYIPEAGKTARSTWELASDSRMSVVVTLDDERSITREFWIEGTTIKTNLVMAPYEEFGGALVGQIGAIPLLDSAHYFGLTDTERTNYVFERMKLPDTYSAASIIAGAERLSLEEEHTEQAEKAKEALIVDLRAAFKPTNERAGDPSLSSATPSIQNGLEYAVTKFRERFTYWNKRKSETQGAVKTLTELKLRENEVTADSINALNREIEAAAETKSGLDTKLGELRAQNDEAARVASRKKEIRGELDEQTDYDGAIKKLRAEIAKAQDKMKPVAKDIAELRLALKGATDTRAELNAELAQHAATLTKAEESLAGLAELKACPYCKSAGKGWQANLEKDIEEKIRATGLLTRAAKSKLTGVEKTITTLTKQVTMSDANELDNLGIKSVISAADQKIETLLHQQKQTGARRVKLEAEYAELEKRPTELNLTAEMCTVEEERHEAATELSRLSGKKEAARQLAQDLKRAAQAELEHQDAAAHVAMIKLIAGYLKEKREAIVAEVFETLLKVANQVCGEILLTPLALHENTIGRWSPEGKFIPHRVFSGTEKALSYIAVSVALSAQSPLKLVLLDEFGRLDTDNQREVLGRLQTLVTEKIIDQFIVLGTSLPDGANVQIIETKP